MRWFTCCHLTALVAMLWIETIVLTDALPVTSEEKEVTLLPNFVLGWTKLSSSNVFRFTLRLDSPVQTWIAVGASRGLGVGTPIMTTDAAAVIAKSGLLNVGYEAQEFELVAKAESGIVPWVTTGPSQTDITRCVQRTCPDDATRCQSSSACTNALQCASQSFGTNGTSALAACTAPLGNGTTPESISDIGAFLDTTGCYFSNCADDLQKNGVRASNLVPGSVTATQEQGGSGFISTLTFSASQIGTIDLSESAVTMIAAYGTESKLSYHGPSHHQAMTLNLVTGVASKASSPDWVTGHAVLMTIGLGILIPIGIVLKALRFSGHAVVQLFGLSCGLVGVGWAAFYVENIGADPHHVLGVVTMVLFVIQPLTYFFRPSESSSSNFRKSPPKQVQRPGTADGQQLLPDSETEVDQRQYMLRLWAQGHAGLGFLALLLAVVTSFLGSDLIQRSEIEATALASLAIVFACFSGAAFAIAVLARVRRLLIKTNKTESSQTQGVMTISSNPNFDNPLVKADDILGDGDKPREDDVKVMPLFLSFQNVTYRAPLTRLEKRQGQTEGKLILSNCAGFCSPGSLTAIMGPVRVVIKISREDSNIVFTNFQTNNQQSGSGKTSLLDILASRSRQSPEAGSVIEVNGVPVHLATKTLSRSSGYVLQEDILHQYLTVFETLMTTARLILPSTFTDQQRYERVMRVVAQLGLGHACDTKVGGSEVRGLSGGERRRVSVGIQIIKSPSLLFLDEPTSGLDSSTATKLVESLRDLANEGRTIVATIHQPSVQIFSFFDRLVLLSAGRVVWSGSRSGAESFFASVSRPVPAKWNPADWFLLVVDTVRDAAGTDDIAVVVQEDNKVDAVKATDDDTIRTKHMSYRLPLGASRGRKQVSEAALRMSVSAESRDMDVSVLTDVLRQFYLENNAEKLRQRPQIVDEVVKYGLREGISKLEEKLMKTYGKGISTALSNAMAMRNTDEPANKEQLNSMVQKFEQHAAYKEIVQRAVKAKDEANSRGGSPVIAVNQLEDNQASGGQLHSSSSSSPVALGQQIRVLTERGATLAWRDPQVLKFQAIQNIIFGIVLGSLYSNLRDSQSRAYTLSMAMVIILGMVAMVTVALNTAVAFSDKQVFVREQSDSMYSPVAHFFARLVVGLPISFVVAACLIVPSYWWIGLKPGAPSFFFFFGVNLAMIFLFDGVVGATAFLANDVTTAFGMGNFYEAISIFMSGIFIPFPLIPPYWSWLYYVTPFSYAYAAVAVNEFENTENEFWIYAIGIKWVNQWGNLLVIILMGIMWRLVGLFLAIRVNKQAVRNTKPKGT